MSKPSIPQGTRDFDAQTIAKRQFITETIKYCFERFGFEPLETPAMENLETLMGKYGDEGDKLIFKILNNGLERPEKRDAILASFDQVLAGKNAKQITERALRYDLTIPFARYVAMNHQQLVFPFKRYQVQPVWRADRPQKGRYREFYQCDADVVGTTSLQAEADLVQLYDMAFAKLGLEVAIRINNRKILAGLAEACDASTLLVPITVIIDKLDKIGLESVTQQLAELGLSAESLDKITRFLALSGSNLEKLEAASAIIESSAIGAEGISELKQVINITELLGTENEVLVDFTLARGLNYYTGAIFEVQAREVAIGSIGGGGRYNDLTGLFGVKGIAGIGISFGLDRIYDCLEALERFPDSAKLVQKVMFFNMGADCVPLVLQQIKKLRMAGIVADLYHEQAKFDKQFKYAEKKNYRTVVIIGPDEMKEGTCQIKRLDSGEQEKVAVTALPELLK